MIDKAKKKKAIVVAIVVVLVVASACCAGGYCWYQNVKVPHDAAVAKYESLSAEIDGINADFENRIAAVQEVVDAGERPLDESSITDAQLALSEAKDAIVVLPELPDKTEEILSVVDEYTGAANYDAEIEDLEAKKVALENSVSQMKQITAPSESFVIERLTGLPHVVDIQAATEDNDPNGQLGKAGGYTAAVYFTSDLVDPDDVYNDGEYGYGAVGQGTDGGGCIEVYATEEDAQARDSYLSGFDGSEFVSGSHAVYGTVLIRTSNNLTASQQNELEQAIYESFIVLK